MALPDVVGKTSPDLPVKKVADWPQEYLANKLTQFSMLGGYGTWVTRQGNWCGDLSRWA